jgi:hypothetical protein
LAVGANGEREDIMKTKRNLIVGVLAMALLGGLSLWQQGLGTGLVRGSNSTLEQTVRAATTQFKSVEAATNAGYAEFYGCVSGPEDGAMGVHYVNGDLVGDGAVDAAHPEAMIYELEGGRLRLVGVEYVVLAADWDQNHSAPPVLQGQVFHYAGSPNRYKIPAFYSLHVWAWKHNHHGTFAEWNPSVSCDNFAG